MDISLIIFPISLRLRAFFVNLLLVCFSIILTLALLEIGLRIFAPEYKYAAQTKLLPSARIFKSYPSSRLYLPHRDTKKKHLVIHNSLGLRQHREFSEEKLPGVTRIGVFGDSYTENKYMPVQYSFTEPLDYLLNRTGQKYEVMNFGVAGYGTDQVLLQYLGQGVKLDLDVVIYVFCHNDITDILENRLFELDKNGNLRFSAYKRNPLKEFLGKFYLTYFLIDKSTRVKSLFFKDYSIPRDHDPDQPEIVRKFDNGVITGETEKSLKIFLALLAQLKQATAEHKTKFYIVLLPYPRSQVLLELLPAKGFEILDLNSEFVQYTSRKKVRFKQDGHWNEEGNKLAAVFLFKYLAGSLGVGSDDAFIQQALYEYYSSFGLDNVSGLFIEKPSNLDESLKNKIVSRYLAIE